MFFGIVEKGFHVGVGEQVLYALDIYRLPRQNGAKRKSTPLSAVPLGFTSSRLIQI